MTDNTQPDEQPDPQPITLWDVLRAVFLPEDHHQAQAQPGPAASTSTAEPEPVPRPIPTVEAPPAPVQPAEMPTEPGEIIYPEATPMEATKETPDLRRVLVLGVGTLVTIIVAVLASIALRGGGGLIALLLTLVTFVLWGGLLIFEFAPPDGALLTRGPDVTGSGAARPLRLIEEEGEIITRASLGVAGLALAVFTFIATADNTFTLLGVLAWLGSIVCVLLALSERDLPDLLGDGLAWLISLRERVAGIHIEPVAVGALLALMAVGAFFRFYQMDAVPPEMTSDHVEKLLDANRILNGDYDVFMRNNGGREALHFYWVALVGAFNGINFNTLKIASAVEAVLLIPVMVVLGRELIDRETGYFAAALVAISWWHILLGRLALRIVLTPLVFALVMIVLIRGLRTGSRRSWLWVGIWLGVGVYSYQSMRIAPLAVAAAVLIAVAGPLIQSLRADDSPAGQLKAQMGLNLAGRQALNLVAAGIVALTIFVPMLRVWRDYPADLWNRVLGRTTEVEAAIERAPAAIFTDNYVDALLMYTVEGDVSWFNALSLEPALGVVAGALLLLGVVAWGIRLRTRRDPVDWVVIAAILVMLLPSALAIAFPLENPSLTRASGTLPLIFVLAAWPLALIRQCWAQIMPLGTPLAALLIAMLLGAASILNARTYFIRYEEGYRLTAPNPGEIVETIREEVDSPITSENVWIISWPFWQDHRAVGLEMGDPTYQQVLIDTAALNDALERVPQLFAQRPLVFILHPDDDDSLATLEAAFPQGDLRAINSRTFGKDFRLYILE